LKSIRRTTASRSAAVDRLAVEVVDILLAHGAFDNYWLDLPFAQSELVGRDFLNGGRVPVGALPEIGRAVAAYVQECLRADGRRPA
jgi:hypothetical protein